MKWLLAIATAAFSPQLATAQETQEQTPEQEMTADEAQAAAREAFGVELPDIENYPDSMVAGAWMQDFEDGEGALDVKTMQLIGLGVAAQAPCNYCIHYHRQAATAAGASEQKLAEAAAMAGYVRNWSTTHLRTEAAVDAYRAMFDGLFAAQ